MEFSIFASLLLFTTSVISQIRPLNVAWSTSKFGPDGPWQAVNVGVGTAPKQPPISLYPGGSFDSNILMTFFCNDTTQGCPASAAGLYDIAGSPTADYTSVNVAAGITGWRTGEPMNMTGRALFTLDDMSVSSFSTKLIIHQAIFSSVYESNITMSNGSSYPVRVGNLALGSPNPVQTFLIGNGSNVTGQLLTGNLKNNNEIPSSSFGLHIGSANLGIPGSLILGGYDQARIVGPVASYDVAGVAGEPIVSLIDVTIGVLAGGTPFNATSIPSLYSAGKNKSTSVILNPLAPYLSLPPSTCAAIAAWLPVTYKPSISLYTWNTDDYRYRTIIQSPAYLAFTFQQTSNDNITIKVPFALLNLTLESPIVATPQQYFPCHPWNSGSGIWHLGRAFLQASYLSINWELNKFFIAQAPGPTLGPTSIQTINPTDSTIQAGDTANGFGLSWANNLNRLDSNTTQSGSTISGMDNGSNEMSHGAKIGIGIGVGLGVAALVALIVFFLLSTRRKKRRREQAAAAAAQQPPLPIIRQPESGESGDLEPQKHPYHGAFGNPRYHHEMAVVPGEFGVPNALHEAPQTQKLYHEAPSTDFAHEIDSTEIGTTTSPSSAWTGRSEFYNSTSGSGRGSKPSVLSGSPPVPRKDVPGRTNDMI